MALLPSETDANKGDNVTKATSREQSMSFLEEVRVRGADFPWRAMPLVYRLVFALGAAVMIFVGVVNFMRADPFAYFSVLFAFVFLALASWDALPARPKIRATDTSLQLWRGDKLHTEITWGDLISNTQSYRLKGCVESTDRKRRIWLYTKGIQDVVPEQLYQLTDWASDHREDIRSAGGSLTRAISGMLKNGIVFRPNSPDENIELGVSAVFGASAAFLVQLFPIRSWWLWAAAAGSVVSIAITAWLMLSYPWRRRESLHVDEAGITHTLAGGRTERLAWDELRQPGVRAHWQSARPNPREGRLNVFDASGKKRISVDGHIRHVLVLDMIFEDLVQGAPPTRNQVTERSAAAGIAPNACTAAAIRVPPVIQHMIP